MTPVSFVVLHGGYGLEMPLLEYLYRVLLSLLAFGGTTIFVFWCLNTVKAIRSTVSAERGRSEHEN